MNCKRLLSGIAGAMIVLITIAQNVSAVGVAILNFSFNNTEFNGQLKCDLISNVDYSVLSQTFTIDDGVVKVQLNVDEEYCILDYYVMNTENQVLAAREGYIIDEDGGEYTFTHNIESDKPYTGLDVETKIQLLADALGVDYSEAEKMYIEDYKQAQQAGGSVSIVTNPSDNKNQGGTIQEPVKEVSVRVNVGFGDIHYLYPLNEVVISRDGQQEIVPVKNNQFEYMFRPGVYEITCKGCQVVKLNIVDKMVTSIQFKPERTLHLVKDCDMLNLTVDGYAWEGEHSGVTSFAVLPTDKVIIDDIDGQKYSYPLSEGVHEYTLNLDNGGATSELVNSIPTQNITEDNPYGIPQTSEKEGTCRDLNYGIYDIRCVVCDILLFLYIIDTMKERFCT